METEEAKELELDVRAEAINYSIALREEEIEVLEEKIAGIETIIDGLNDKFNKVEAERELLYAI
jgi:hypothetical protein